MSFGKMRFPTAIVEPRRTTDMDGFTSLADVTLATVRAYKEGRHGSQRWANLASFSEATDLFRFRVIPGIPVTERCYLVCNGERYDIISVEDVKGRGVYLEVLAKKVVAAGG